MVYQLCVTSIQSNIPRGEEREKPWNHRPRGREGGAVLVGIYFESRLDMFISGNDGIARVPIDQCFSVEIERLPIDLDEILGRVTTREKIGMRHPKNG